MVNCCVVNCTNYSAKTNKWSKITSYHRIPREKSLQKSWIARVKRDNMPPLENTYVCSEHFTEDCFDSLKESLLPNEKLKRRLKLDAVPSVFPHSNPKRPRQSSEKRAERQHRKELTTKVSDQVSLCSIYCYYSVVGKLELFIY